jgi:hypothetical protein
MNLGMTLIVSDLDNFTKKVAKFDASRCKSAILYVGKVKNLKIDMTHEQFEQLKGVVASGNGLMVKR